MSEEVERYITDFTGMQKHFTKGSPPDIAAAREYVRALAHQDDKPAAWGALVIIDGYEALRKENEALRAQSDLRRMKFEQFQGEIERLTRQLHQARATIAVLLDK